MHDELMSSMDISQKMLKLTACAILPLDDHKHLNDIQSSAADNDSNDSAINDMNVCTDSLTQNPDTTDFKAKTEESIRGLVSELSNDETNHICEHFSRDESAVEADDEQQSVAIESANGVVNESNDTNSESPLVEDQVLDNGLEVVDGCVYPPYDPPEDKVLRFTNQLQFLRTIMTKYLCRYKTALPFLKPVNCVQLKIPDYYKVVTNPMDMLTIKRRMLCLWYSSADECLQDFKLMFNNCYNFNSCDNYVYKAGKKLEEYLEEKLKEMPSEEIEIACPAKQSAAELEKRAAKRKPEVPTQELHDLSIGQSLGSPDMASLLANSAKKPTTRSEHGIHMKKPTKELPESVSGGPTPHHRRVQLNTSMKFCLEIIRELMSKKHRDYAWPFYEPVSTQQYPDYLEIVKKPIDLSTIKTKIETGQYKTVKPFVKDMRLMITNCLRYNKPEAPVIEQARKLRDFFEYRWARIPEELLKEKLTTSQTHSHQNGNTSSEHSAHKRENTEETAVENSRMKLLETQVRLLTSTLTALTGIEAKTLKPKNGQKKTDRKRNTKRVNNRTTNRKNSTAKKADDDEEDEESDEEFITSPSPIAFDPNNMEDLQQLKTDLENLNAKDLKNVLRILRQTEPSIKCDNDENIEIDFEALKPETLNNLRKFVSSCMLNSTKKRPANCDMKNGHSLAARTVGEDLRLSDSSSDESESSSDSDSD